MGSPVPRGFALASGHECDDSIKELVEPLLRAWAWISRHEQENVRKRLSATYDAAV